MTEITKLIALWNSRPQRVEPDDESHLLYIFTGLLPALRDAMPAIVALSEAQAIGSPNTGLPPAPVQEPNSHSQGQTLNTDDTVEASGPATDNAGKPASLPATGAETVVFVPAPQQAKGKRAKARKTRKSSAVPPAQPQGTGETAPA